MGKQLLAVLNREIPLGVALNALAHLTLGMGHRLPPGGSLALAVRFAPARAVYEFRQAARCAASGQPERTLFSDFTHTMTEGTAEDQLIRTQATPEAAMTYYAVCLGGDEERLQSLWVGMDRAMYQAPAHDQPYRPPGGGEFGFLPAVACPNDPSLPPQKISLVLNGKVSVGVLLDALMLACLEVGRRADLRRQRLLTFVDAEGGEHPNVSYHPLPVLLPKSAAKLSALFEMACGQADVTTHGVFDREKTPLAVCVLGERPQVEALADRRYFSFWRRELSDADFPETAESVATSDPSPSVPRP